MHLFQVYNCDKWRSREFNVVVWALYARNYLTVILRTWVEYELIADEARSAKSAIAHIRREWVE